MVEARAERASKPLALALPLALTVAHLRNNLLLGPGELTSRPAASARANRRAGPGGFVDAATDDHHLRLSSPPVDRGVPVPRRWRPRWEYAHPARLVRRPSAGRPDLGAHELR